MTAPPFPARMCLVVWLCLCGFSAPAQQQPPARPEQSDEVIRVTTELVQTDVVVFDKQGHFVDNLRPEDFDLRVDGHAQNVSFFERVLAGSVNEEAQLAAARGGRDKANAGSNATVRPLDRGRVIFFFIDDLHLSTASLIRTRALLLRYIDEQLGQNDQVALVTTSGQVGFLQQLTDEKDVLRAAVNRLAYRELTVRDNTAPPMGVMEAVSIERNDIGVINAFVDAVLSLFPSIGGRVTASDRSTAESQVRGRANQLLQQTNSISTRTLTSLQNLLHTSAQLPGRKLVYFISDGFVLDSGESDMLDRIRRVTDAAVRAGVVVYTLDARGLSGALAGGSDASSDGVFDASGRMTGVGNEATALQEPLRVIAGETGGRALLNSNSLANALTNALQETSIYYLLAWRPEQDESRGGRFRRIEVSVRRRPELTVLVQRGFFTTEPTDAPVRKHKEAKRETKHADTNDGAAPVANIPAANMPHPALMAALKSFAPKTALPTALTLNYLNTPEYGLLLASSLQVTVAMPASTQNKHIDVVGAVYNQSGQVVASFERHITVTPKASESTPPAPTVAVTTNAPQQIVTTHQTRIAPGLYQVRVAAREVESGHTGSASQWLTVPALDGGKLTLSSIFLGERPRGAEAAGQGAPEQTQALVNPERRFLRNTVLRFVLYVYNPALVNPTTAPDVALQLQIFRDDQPVVTTPLRKVATEGLPNFTTLPYAAEISLQDLPTGRYILQATAIDRTAKTSATQRVKFIVE